MVFLNGTASPCFIPTSSGLCSTWDHRRQKERTRFAVIGYRKNASRFEDRACQWHARSSKEHGFVVFYPDFVGALFDLGSPAPKREDSLCESSLFGAGDRGRTDTVSLPLDFESSTSANSITPAYNVVIISYQA